MITLLIVDDQPLQRMGFRMLLDSQDDLNVVAEASNGAEAVAACVKHNPDVVLMDIRMPVMDGIEATRRIVAAGGPTKVLVLTTFEVDEYVFGALRAGASGFLLKDALPEDLLAGIKAVAAGDAVVAPRMTRKLIDRFASTTHPNMSDDGNETGSGHGSSQSVKLTNDRLERLTAREREVLTAIGHGHNNAEIAAQFHVAESTVKTHINRILTKIEARDRVQAVIFAYDVGLVR